MKRTQCLLDREGRMKMYADPVRKRLLAVGGVIMTLGPNIGASLQKPVGTDQHAGREVSECGMSEISGTWVRKIQNRNFMVLKLSGSRGTLTIPSHFTEISGNQITVTDAVPRTLVVSCSRLKNGMWRLKFAIDSTSNMRNSHRLHLWDSKHASLNYYNAEDMSAWFISREGISAAPTISRSWVRQSEREISEQIASVQKRLRAMVIEDQDADKPPFTGFAALCKKNYAELHAIYKTYGWLKSSVFGREASSDFWLLCVHQAQSHLTFAQKALASMKGAVMANEALLSNYAIFYDAVAKEEGRPQHWGTKTTCKNGQRKMYSVDDVAGLERRRDEAGLPPFDFYVRSLPPCFH